MSNGFELIHLLPGWLIGCTIATVAHVSVDAYNLNKCAKENNVYWCKYIAVPVEQPRVVIKKPDLLPPPDVKVGK